MTYLSPLRSGRITGSRVGAVLGVDPYKAADDVMREMVRQHFGDPDEFVSNPAIEHGIRMEPVAVAWYEEETRRPVERHTSDQTFVAHPSVDWLGVTPDGFVETVDPGTVEVKCPLWAHYTSIGQCPHYQAQVQLQLACTGRDWCDFVIWRPQGVIVEPVARDPWWLEENLDVLEKFHDDYLAVIASEELAAPHRTPLVDERADGEWVAASVQWLEAVYAVERAERAQEELRGQLVRLAGGKKTRGSGVLVQAVVSKGSVDYSKAVAELVPDGADLEKYRRPGRTTTSVRRVKT